jgi:hypothetical protein
VYALDASALEVDGNASLPSFPRTIRWAYALGPMDILWGWVHSLISEIPLSTRILNAKRCRLAKVYALDASALEVDGNASLPSREPRATPDDHEVSCGRFGTTSISILMCPSKFSCARVHLKFLSKVCIRPSKVNRIGRFRARSGRERLAAQPRAACHTSRSRGILW